MQGEAVRQSHSRIRSAQHSDLSRGQLKDFSGACPRVFLLTIPPLACPCFLMSVSGPPEPTSCAGPDSSQSCNKIVCCSAASPKILPGPTVSRITGLFRLSGGGLRGFDRKF